MYILVHTNVSSQFLLLFLCRFLCPRIAVLRLVSIFRFVKFKMYLTVTERLFGFITTLTKLVTETRFFFLLWAYASINTLKEKFEYWYLFFHTNKQSYSYTISKQGWSVFELTRGETLVDHYERNNKKVNAFLVFEQRG